MSISHKTISRKHLTIQVDPVVDGDGVCSTPRARTSFSANCEQLNYKSRSQVTIEDLNTKKGTLLNGVSMQGQKRVLAGDANDIQLGTCSQIFR